MTDLTEPNPARARRVASWLLCALVGLGAGLLNGLLGAAGGILLVTVLPHLRLPQPLLSADSPNAPKPGEPWARRDVLATSMAVMLPVSAVSWVFYLVGGIRPSPQTAALLVLPSVLGGLLGAYLLGRLPDRWLRRLFAALVVVAGMRMLL